MESGGMEEISYLFTLISSLESCSFPGMMALVSSSLIWLESRRVDEILYCEGQNHQLTWHEHFGWLIEDESRPRYRLVNISQLE